MRDFKNYTPEELMIIYQKDSPEKAYLAFEELYFRFSGRVYNFIKKKNMGLADAEDILQKVFFKIHVSKHLYDVRFKFEQWIFVIARTTTIDFQRKESRDLKNIQKLIYGNETEEFEVNFASEELDFFENLEQDQKEILELKYIDNYSYKEISKMLSRPETALRKMVSRMVVKIRNGDV